MSIFNYARTNGYNLNQIKTLMLKMFYGIKLDKINKNIDLCNQTGTIIEKDLSEYEVQEWLYKYKRTNKKPDEIQENKSLYLELKRRSGKSMLGELIARYENSKLNKAKVLILGNTERELRNSLTFKEKNIEQRTYFSQRSYFGHYDFVLFENYNCYKLQKNQTYSIVRNISCKGKFVITDDYCEENELKKQILKSDDGLYYKLYSSLANESISKKNFFNTHYSLLNYDDFFDDLYPRNYIWKNKILQ